MTLTVAKRQRQPGFTLVEVMVALAVVALALPALMFALYQQVDGTGYLRDKSLAQMVASNKLVELRLLTAARSGLFSGVDSGVEELAGRQWHWRLASSATQVQSFYRVEIAVREGEEESGLPLYTLVAFMFQDPRQAAEVPGEE
ncbi:type II secretion system minor pseudopilin GspI [Haliea sp. E1-2-M8]|uniref:type II secretion system minor pseudopilin GspI n=1 Tax=Haliea sp. E1-2-M8 TaxID=3064706 RepID=UPI002715AD2F|nr:type II secretion system minor pseudopilin GspI [Haliea sp. E1-2-M8]MDO8862209.1 type II secretion system minor pseudopilin GspI [Haliea sp. E1-2-M8]